MLTPVRVAVIAALAATLLLALGACSGGSPAPGTAGIPPCVPIPGSPVDPCDPGAPPIEMGVAQGVPDLGDAPTDARWMLDVGGSTAWVAHVVVRGTYLPNTVRCAGGDPFRPATYALAGFGDPAGEYSMKCYANVRANEYIVGSGPSTLTVMLFRYAYFHDQYGSIWTGDGTQTIHDDALLFAPGFEGLYSGREHVLFLGPPADLSSEAWQLISYWDVQRRDDGTVVAVHPERDLWRRLRPDDYEAHQAALEIELPTLAQAVTTASQARATEHGGRIGAEANLPMLITNAGRGELRRFYTSAGAYASGVPAPAQPPAPCGLSVPDWADNPGLMRGLLRAAGSQGRAPRHRRPQLGHRCRNHRLGRRDRGRDAPARDQAEAGQRGPDRDHPGVPSRPDRAERAQAGGEHPHRLHPGGVEGCGVPRPGRPGVPVLPAATGGPDGGDTHGIRHTPDLDTGGERGQIPGGTSILRLRQLDGGRRRRYDRVLRGLRPGLRHCPRVPGERLRRRDGVRRRMERTIGHARSKHRGLRDAGVRPGPLRLRGGGGRGGGRPGGHGIGHGPGPGRPDLLHHRREHGGRLCHRRRDRGHHGCGRPERGVGHVLHPDGGGGGRERRSRRR